MSHITEGASFQKKNKKNSFRPRTPSTQKNLYELIFLLIFLFWQISTPVDMLWGVKVLIKFDLKNLN